jgi:hypothetical protein
MRLLVLLVLLAPSSRAQGVGACETGTATATLSSATVEAHLFNTGSLFYGGNLAAAYNVGGDSPVYAAGIWIGGKVDGEVRVAGSRYTDFEFWPGPLDEGGTLPDPTDCSAYDRIWVVSRADVATYEESGEATADLAEWPAALGAPWTDADGDGAYSLEAGDRPVVYGTQTAFWVMNDVGNEHEETLSAPLGVEVRVTAFTVTTETFYRYEILNRSDSAIEDARFAFFSDPDLGSAADDYVGIDSTRGMGFVYNADNLDDNHYGYAPPAFGVDFLQGTGAFTYYIGGGPPELTDPGVAEEYYNVMLGLAPNGTSITAYGNGVTGQGEPTVYAFPGDPETDEFWSEVNVDGNGTNGQPGDRRSVVSSNSFTLEPGARQVFDIGLLFARGVDHLASVTTLKARSDHYQERYEQDSLFVPLDSSAIESPAAPELLAPADGAEFVEEEPTLTWAPVEDAAYYIVELMSSPGSESFARSTTGATSGPARAWGWPPNTIGPLYWRVLAVNEAGLEGLPSETRSLSYYYYEPGILTTFHPELGVVPVYLEVVAPGGAAPCEPNDPSFGCAEFGGDFVNASLNSDGTYFVTVNGPAGSEATIGGYAPHDFEIRFGEPSYGIWYFNENEDIAQVPFSVYDIGPEGPTGNDPSNDVQLIPILFADNGGVCEFEFGEGALAFGAYETTDRIYAYYATTSYEDWAAEAEALLGGDSDACVPGLDTGIVDLIAFGRGRPIQRQVIGDFATPNGSVSHLDGAVVRFPTAKPLFPTAAEEGAPTETLPTAAALEGAYPNPTRSGAAIPFVLEQQERVRLVVYDVLGREVAVLLDDVLPAGAYEAPVAGGQLAAGVYLVVLEADGERHARRFTVLR